MKNSLKQLPAFLFFLTLSCMFGSLFFPVSLFDYYTRDDGTKGRRNRITNIHQTYTPVGWKDKAEFAQWQEEQSNPVRHLFSSLDVVSPRKQWSPIILDNPSDWDFSIDDATVRVEYFSINPDTKKKECLFSGQEGLQPNRIPPQQRASFTMPAQLPDTVFALPHGTDIEVDVTILVSKATNLRTHLTVFFGPPASRTIRIETTHN